MTSMIRSHQPSMFPRRQRGVATLFVSLVALVLITLATLFANRNAIFEQVTSANHYRYSQAFEAAAGGLEYAIAWLGTNGNPNCNADPATCPYNVPVGGTGAAWVVDTTTHPPYNQKNTVSVAAQTFNGYTATVTLWRNSASPLLVEIVSVATGDATATVRQIVSVNALMFTSPALPPVTVNGCISNVTGNPSINAQNAVSNAIVSSTGPVGSACIDPGHFAVTGQTVANGFAGSAWDQTFSTPKDKMLGMAQRQTGGAVAGPIFYYDYVVNTVGNVWNPPAGSTGSPTSPVIVIFDNPPGSDCPKLNGNMTLYGIVYCNSGLDMTGWGNTNIYGSLVSDSAITKFTANTTINFNAAADNPINYPVQPIISRVSGSWRDF
ncbi:MAG: hypothetical protein JSR69_00555 [Proteobacteria bacterium]|nr:hypothetical protein [Pseudomonadota bacterium]